MSKVLLCLGDSITQGNASCNYISLFKDMLSQQNKSTDDISVINAGINGDTAYKLNTRLDEAMKCNPDYVTILIGTNDILASSFEKIRKMALKGNKLKEDYIPTQEAFIKDVKTLISKIKHKSNAKIALFSIPILGEDINSEVNIKIKSYNEALKLFANNESIEYLDLFSEQISYLEKNKKIPGITIDENIYNKLYLSLCKRYLLRRTWDQISSKNKMQLTTDGIHMNSISAKMISHKIYDFIFGTGRGSNG